MNSPKSNSTMKKAGYIKGMFHHLPRVGKETRTATNMNPHSDGTKDVSMISGWGINWGQKGKSPIPLEGNPSIEQLAQIPEEVMDSVFLSGDDGMILCFSEEAARALLMADIGLNVSEQPIYTA